jgi:O-antigen/teichoic acid export membrane protein
VTVSGDEEGLGRGELQRRAVDGVMWNLLNIGVAMPVSFVANLFIARALGVVDYGRLAVLTAFVEILSFVLVGGLGQAVTQYGAKAHASGDSPSVARLLRGYQGLRLTVELPIYALAYAVLADVPGPLRAAAIVIGLVLPAVIGNGAICFAIENRSGTGARLVLAATLVSQPIVVVVAMLTGSADYVWLARMVAPVGLAFASLAFIAPVYRRAIARPLLPPRLPKGLWRFSAEVGLASLVGGLVMSRTEVFALTAWSSAAAAGEFAIAFGLVSHVLGPPQAIVGPMVPALASLRTVDEVSLGRAIRRTLRAMSTLAGTLSATVLPALGPIVPVLYGREFAAADPLIIAVGGLGAMASLAGPLAAVGLSRLAGGSLLRINLAALGVDAALMVALIPPLGVWGAVLANGGASLLRAGLLLHVSAQDLGVPAGTLARSGLPSVLGAAWAGVAWALAMLIAPESEVLRAVIGAAVGGVGFVASLALLRTGLSAGDRDAILVQLPRRIATVARPWLGQLARANAD